MPRPALLTAWLLLPFTLPASAQGGAPAWRVVDLTPGSERTEVAPVDAVLFDGRIFFSGEEASVGRELWATDGTKGGQRLIADLVPGPASSYVRQLTVVGERLFFEACGPTRGCELWTSNGDPGGTHALTDIDRGPAESSAIFPFVRDLSAWQDLAVFLLDDGERGYEPWVSDGTSAGTVLLAEIVPGREPVSPEEAPELREVVLFDGRLFFTGWGPLVGHELWASDGTAGGLRLIADLFPGSPSSDVRQLTIVGDRLFFEACGPTRGCDLWTWSGDLPGARLLTDARPGPEDFVGRSAIFGLSAWQELAVFLQDDGERGYEPWVSDGTNAGTVLLAELAPGREPVELDEIPELKVAGSTLFLLSDGRRKLWASTTPGQAPELLVDLGDESRFLETMTVGNHLLYSIRKGRYELWVSDGTVGGTQIVPAAIGSRLPMDPIGTVNGLAYLAQSYLLVSDGTVGGTRSVRPVGFASPSIEQFTPRPTATWGDSLFFVSNRHFGIGPGTSSLWQLRDDTVELVYSWLNYQILDMAATRDTLYMVQRYTYPADPDFAPVDLVMSDGSREAPRRLLEDFSEISGLVARQDELFFRARDETSDALWRTDGTQEGTVRLTSTRQPRDSTPSDLTAHGDQVVFRARNRLGLSDGRLEGTRLLDASGGGLRRAGGRTYVFTPGLRVLGEDGGLRQVFSRGHVRATAATELDGRLYFLAWNFDTYAYELRSSDGTEEGTYLVRELTRERRVLHVGLYAAGDRLFASVGNFFWVSDGSREDGEGTPGLSMSDLCPKCYPVFSAAAAADRLFLVLQDIQGPQQLWATDGTVEGSVLVTSSAAIRSLTAAGGRLFFVATDELGDELWASDGTPEGTSRRLDILPGPRSSLPADLTAVPTASGERLFFSADDGVRGRELWTSDGTAEGTRLVAEAWPGVGSGEPSELEAVGDRLLFSAQDGLRGLEPWVSDGTAEGTRLVYDAYRGVRSSEPYGFVRAGGLVFFAARDGAGVELWAADAEALE